MRRLRTTELGGAGAGVLFTMRADGSCLRIVHSFGVAPGDGERPYGSLLALDGWLYGTATLGATTEAS